VKADMDAYELSEKIKEYWREEFMLVQNASDVKKEKVSVPVYVYTEQGAVKIKSVSVDPTLGIMLELEDGK
jgi:hypothetical protein